MSNQVDVGGIVGDPVQIVVGAWDELGAAINRLDPKALQKFRGSVPQRIQLLNAAAQRAPAAQPLVSQVLVPLMQKSANVADSAAKSAAIARRIRTTADQLESATHIIPVCFDALANGGNNSATISAPHDGQPWRYLAMFAASTASVGTRITDFSLAGVNHVVTRNVTYTSSPTNPGLDFALFGGNNQLAAMLPNFRWRPWGLKGSGVIRPDGKITLGVENRSGASASIFCGLCVQSSPCGEGSVYDQGKGGVYALKDKNTKQFLQKLVRFTMFGG